MTTRFDHVFLSRIVAGATEEFCLVVEEFQQRVRRVIYRQVGDMSVTEDLTQQTFLKAFENLESFRSDSNLGTWLIRIALNETSTYFSSKRFRQSKITDAIESTPEPATNDELNTVIPIFRKALSELSPILREAFVLCALEGYQYSEVAEMLGISIGTVRSRVNAARLKLSESFVEDES